MTDGIQISVKIDFYRNIDEDFSPGESAVAQEDHVGSMLKDGVRSLCVPRIGERVRDLGLFMPFHFAPVGSVVHRLAGIDSEEGQGDSPSVTVSVTVPWPGDGVREQLVEHFEGRGWTWYEARGDSPPGSAG